MPRFYCPLLAGHLAAVSAADRGDRPPAAPEAPPPVPPPVLPLPPEEARHASRVLRLRAGDAVEVFDGQGGLARGRLASSPRGPAESLSVEVCQAWHVPPPTPALTVAVAWPKGALADQLLASLSQLGADRVLPLKTARGVVDPRAAKLERLRRAAIESAKQCGRAYLLAIDAPRTLAQTLALPHDLALIARPDAPVEPVADLAARLRQATGVLILIGPEGGWTEEEQRQAEQAGCRGWRLGPLVQRIETAAAAATAIARFLVPG